MKCLHDVLSSLKAEKEAYAKQLKWSEVKDFIILMRVTRDSNLSYW